jgi:hypothetical protein
VALPPSVSAERRVLWLAAGFGLVNVLVALFALPHSPGLDDPALYTSIYSYQHYGQLSFPDDDAPFMYKHPPTKYWVVGLLVSAGVPLRLATAGLFLASYLLVLAAAFACRFTFFQSLAVLFAVPATLTLCPFISYSPENLAHGEAIGRLRPDDLVLTFWLSGLLWLEAARREGQRLLYGVAGGVCIGLASVTHWFGIPALAAIAVYLAASRFEKDSESRRRGVYIGLASALVLLPFWIVIRPYWPQVWTLLSSQGGEPAPGGLVAAWTRHSADYWFLYQWMKMHAIEVWAATALLSVPVILAIPPIVIATPILLALPSTRVFGFAAIWLPSAVLRANHKSIGYELPELSLYLLAIGWLVAQPMDRITSPRIRILSGSLFLLPILTSSPAVWHPQTLRFMDQSHSLDLLRSVGRALVGPGATVVGRFYTSGADNWVQSGLPEDPGIDFVATREFDLLSAPLHRSYLEGRTRVTGFVLAPEMPSASLVYFRRSQKAEPVTGFVLRRGEASRFSPSQTGWTFDMLSCEAKEEDLSWVWPAPPGPVSGYTPRTNHCVADAISGTWPDSAASVLLRRTRSLRVVSHKVLVALLRPATADNAAIRSLESRCSCMVVQEASGGLTDVPASWLVTGLRRSDSVIRMYATSADFAANRSMAARFGEPPPPRPQP